MSDELTTPTEVEEAVTPEEVIAEIVDTVEEPVEESKPKRAYRRKAVVEPELEPELEPDEAPALVPSQPKASSGIRVRVLQNYLHDGKRLRARGEVITLTERQLANVGDAVERI